MNRKLMNLVIMVAIIAIALFGATGSSFAATVPTISIPLVNTAQGQTFDVLVNVDTAGTGIRAYQFNLGFDATRIQVNSVTDGGFLATAGAGACTSPVPPTINNTVGTITAASCALLGGPGLSANGIGTLAKVNVTVKAAAPNGKALFTMTGFQLRDVAAALVAGVVTDLKWLQVGPGPNLGISVGFTPIGTGSSFNTSVIVTNSGGSASDPDTLTVALTNVTPAVSATFAVPSLAIGASQTFSIPASVLSAGASNSVATATLVTVGTVKTATYSPVSATGQTNVDATFGAFLTITPDSQVTFGTLALGANTKAGNLNVKCNTSYQVDVFDNNPTAWHMTEFNGTTFGALKLAGTMSIASAQNTVTALSPAKLVNGLVAGQSGALGQDFPLTYSQNLVFADPLLPAGETYHLVLTLNAYVTL